MEQINQDKLKLAIDAWATAIKIFIGREYPTDESIEEVARSVAKNYISFNLTDDKHLRFASTMFNWDIITHYLKNQNNGSPCQPAPTNDTMNLTLISRIECIESTQGCFKNVLAAHEAAINSILTSINKTK